MSKARVIVADTDINYIIPLQLKFAEEFFDAIDLEIISDRSYFEELFASPQKADILVVSEELYDASLQRHNISNIFLMTEQYEENQTAELNVNRIFKYTSIKEIFNEITGKSASALKIQKESQEPKIVLVYSACGGTGKTTIALGIAAALTDFNLPEFTRQVFDMYDGSTETVTLLCKNDMMNYIVDRFGDAVETSPTDHEHFAAVAEVSVSQTFFAWVFQFNGDIQIKGPESVVDRYKAMLTSALDK